MHVLIKKLKLILFIVGFQDLYIGIVNYISSLFLKEDIPLLYINTFSYNLILISDDYIEQAKNILKNIIY
jgi:hypothetical protein